MLEPSQNWNCKLHTFFLGRAHFENWMDSLDGWTTTRGKTPEQNVYALIKEVTYGQKLPNHWILFTKMCQNIVGLKSLCLKIHEPFSILSYLLRKFRKIWAFTTSNYFKQLSIWVFHIYTHLNIVFFKEK